VWGITSACEVARQEFRRRGCSMLRSCLRPSPWHRRSALLFSWRPMVDLIKSQLLPAWPFSSVTLRYQQHFLRKLLTERAGYADLRDEVACEPAASI
jgi:hypothetical protein